MSLVIVRLSTSINIDWCDDALLPPVFTSLVDTTIGLNGIVVPLSVTVSFEGMIMPEQGERHPFHRHLVAALRRKFRSLFDLDAGERIERGVLEEEDSS